MPEAWKQWEGQVIEGEFPLREYLGGSEHSAVFLTEHRERELEKAAIKLIAADAENAELQLSRWKLAAELTHRHLIKLFRSGRWRLGGTDLLYVVMEYAEEDLSQILPQRALTPAEVGQMLEPVLDALEYVHSKGFVHGNLKPGNIQATADQVKISSDGLRRIGEANGGLRKPSGYDPPEAGHGEVTSAGDSWSLGMTLIEVLTQRLPIWKESQQADPVLPETIPQPFLDITRNCLRRDPQRRWTVGDIEARLEQPTRLPAARRSPIVKPQTERAKRRQLVPGVAVAAVLVLAGLALVPKLFNHRTEAHRETPVAPQKSAAQVKTAQRMMKAENNLSAPRITEKRQAVEKPTASPTSLRMDTGAKTPNVGGVQDEVLQEVMPEVSEKARDTIRGAVRVGVRIHIDPAGNVTGAELESPGPSRYFADLALKAARRWEFAPGKVDGQYVPSEWRVRFEFRQSGTRAFPARTAP